MVASCLDCEKIVKTKYVNDYVCTLHRRRVLDVQGAAEHCWYNIKKGTEVKYDGFLLKLRQAIPNSEPHELVRLS